MSTLASWPTDPGECHDLLNRLTQQVEDLQAATEDFRAALDQAAKLHDQTVQEHQQTIDELRRQLDLYRRYVFGPRRERLVEAPAWASVRAQRS
jgi:predicted  nucleic acid-binding Zn-ribbon protein